MTGPFLTAAFSYKMSIPETSPGTPWCGCWPHPAGRALWTMVPYLPGKNVSHDHAILKSFFFPFWVKKWQFSEITVISIPKWKPGFLPRLTRHTLVRLTRADEGWPSEMFTLHLDIPLLCTTLLCLLPETANLKKNAFQPLPFCPVSTPSCQWTVVPDLQRQILPPQTVL